MPVSGRAYFIRNQVCLLPHLYTSEVLVQIGTTENLFRYVQIFLDLFIGYTIGVEILNKYAQKGDRTIWATLFLKYRVIICFHVSGKEAFIALPRVQNPLTRTPSSPPPPRQQKPGPHLVIT